MVVDSSPKRYSVLLLLLIFGSLSCLLSTTRANAFIPSHSVLPHQKHKNNFAIKNFRLPSSNIMSSELRERKTNSATAIAAGGGKTAEPEKPKIKKVRISAFDSMRFFLISFICIGHFIRFADPSDLVMKLFAQVNVVVGAFFILSGYVAAYTSTDVGAYESSPKLADTPSWIVPRIMGYFPLHLLVLILFSPMFLYADVSYNGWPTAIAHGVMSATMIQAWFPMHAEVWNAPTWFLSALSFATAILPFSIPKIAKMNKPALRRVALYLTLTSLLPKIGYSYDHNVWGAMEGMTAPKAFPNLAIFNTQRFNPFFATVEVLLGVVTCRLVMLDDAPEYADKKPSTNVLSTLLPLLGMVGILVLRALDLVKLNDHLTRTVIFLPLFIKFLMAAHRESVKMKVTDPVVKFLSSGLLTKLGSIAFPIFVIHGPIGQMFYKKIIAKKLFGGTLNALYGPNMFYAYLATVGISSFLLKVLFLDNKAVGTFSKNMASKLSKKL